MNEGIWISTEFPPEAEGVYQRRGEDGQWFLRPKYWNGHEWIGYVDKVPMAFYQSGEYLLPAGSWAVTKGVRPPLAKGTMVHTKFSNGRTSENLYPDGHTVEHRDWVSPIVKAFRLVPALKPKCEHRWDAYGHGCLDCHINRQAYEATFVKPVQREAEAVNSSQSIRGNSLRSQDVKPAASLPIRDRFGLKWPAEVRSRTVPKECPVNAMRVWRDK